MKKINISYNDVDFISVAGHKIHALNSSGLLIKNKSLELTPINAGGGQENGFRSGTNDVALASTISKALRLTNEKLETNLRYVSKLHDHLISYLLDNKDIYHLNSLDNKNQ